MAEEVQVCPNCGSLDVHVSREDVTDMMGMDHEYACHNCGFTSKLFPVVPAENVEEFEEAFKEEVGERYMNRDWGFSESWSNHPRIIIGALLVFFGIAAIPFPGVISPVMSAIILVIAGIALVAYELHERNK